MKESLEKPFPVTQKNLLQGPLLQNQEKHLLYNKKKIIICGSLSIRKLENTNNK